VPYGVSDDVWKYLPQEDKNSIINSYNAAQGSTAPQLSTAVYVSPAAQALEQQYGITSSPSPAGPTYGAPASPAPAQTQNPQWIFAVNLPSTYPDFSAMRQAGSGLVIVADDPNFQVLLDGAREWGIQVAIQVNAPPGITPEQYAQRVAQAQAFAPDRLVLDIEAAGKGYAGSPGWEFSNQVAALIKPIVGSTPLAVTMEPNQDDYNYAAYTGLGAQVWVQSYTGDMAPVDPTAAAARVAANGVNPSQIIPILGPNQQPTTRGLYSSYGIPTTGASAAGVYGGTYIPGTSVTYGVTPGGQALAGATATYMAGVTSTPSASTASAGSTNAAATVDATSWATAYFGSLGLPPELVGQIDQIFRQHDDPQVAAQFALAYVRGTPWYAQTYPGIKEGIQKGVVGNEADYRSYLNAVNGLMRQYFGRDVSSSEVAGYLSEGLAPQTIGQQFQGLAGVMAYGQDWRYYLGGFGEEGTQQPTNDDLRALGEEQAGRDSPLGLRLKRSLDMAMQRYSKLFEGNLAAPSLSLGATGLSAPSLLGGRTKPDIAA
jgi:hypothetical protein